MFTLKIYKLEKNKKRTHCHQFMIVKINVLTVVNSYVINVFKLSIKPIIYYVNSKIYLLKKKLHSIFIKQVLCFVSEIDYILIKTIINNCQ